ncbi:hypothetical protein VNI00_014047 [Paramarasmius palmivorus]|uniref:Uncharacterized protein n=1 Tax=Paramarasmius palmivorus TaxID=297713 RepID=A0AAW0BV09_9AGAR
MNRFGRFSTSASNDNKSEDTSKSSSDTDVVSLPTTSDSAQSDLMIGSSPKAPQIAASEYAKETIQLNRRIATLGTGFEFDFPRVAVVGAQSSGKSSLVEAISGVSVPRYSNTCTRCPMECTMIPEGTEWSCTINLKTTVGGLTSTQRFGPALITDKNDVELWITRAQAAILSPERKAEFKKMGAEELRRIMREDDRFSKDVIEIEVRDPSLPPLTFVDLPGLIQNHSKSNEMISIVETMVKSFIGGAQRSNTLMLIVMPANEEANNQKAMKLAKDYDKHGARTIGVLTKPDQIRPGDLGLKENAREALEGLGDHRLRNGYYCVRLPNDAERKEKLGSDIISARAEKLFGEAEPWSEVTNRSVFGVNNLVSSVSTLLVNIILANLPKLKKQTEDKLARCRSELHNLPPLPTGRPLVRLMELIRLFSEDVNHAVMGHEHRQYAQKNRGDIYAQLRSDIWRTGVNFKPYLPDSSGSSVTTDIETSEEPWSHTCIPEPERIKMPQLTDSMDLKQVRQVILKSIAWELPGHIPFQATIELVQRSTSQWRKPALACFDAVFEYSGRLFEEMISKRFENYDALRHAIREITRQHHQACKKDALVLLEKSIRLETNPLYTQNYHYYDTQRRKWRSHFRDALSKRLEAQGGSSTNQLQEYQSELDLMGDARAYFKVAYKRFVDYIPLLIEHELSQEFAGHLYECFVDKLPLHDEKKLAELMAEKVIIRTKREQLGNDISRLEEMLRLLEDYEERSSESEGVKRLPYDGPTVPRSVSVETKVDAVTKSATLGVRPSLAPEPILPREKPTVPADAKPDYKADPVAVRPSPFDRIWAAPGAAKSESFDNGSGKGEASMDPRSTTPSASRKGGKRG